MGKGKKAEKDENLHGARAARLRLQNVASKIKHGSAFLLAPEKDLKAKKKEGEKEEGGRKAQAARLRLNFETSKISTAYPSVLAGNGIDTVDGNRAVPCPPHGCRCAAFLQRPVVVPAYGKQHVSAVEHCLVSVHKLLGDARRMAVPFDVFDDGDNIGFSKHALVCGLAEQSVFLPAAVLPDKRNEDVAYAADALTCAEGGLVCSLCASGAKLDGIKRKAVLPGDIGESLLDEMLKRLVWLLGLISEEALRPVACRGNNHKRSPFLCFFVLKLAKSSYLNIFCV